MKKKRYWIIGILIILAMNVLGYYYTSKMIRESQQLIYKQGWADGWRNHVDYDLCLLGDKAALMQQDIPRMYDCVSREEAKGTTHDVLIDELP